MTDKPNASVGYQPNCSCPIPQDVYNNVCAKCLRPLAADKPSASERRDEKIKVCSKCKKEFTGDFAKIFGKNVAYSDGFSCQCKVCRRAAASKDRARLRHKRSYEKTKVHAAARKKARTHFADQSFQCSVVGCLSEGKDLHHVDYTKPLDIVPLCPPHHSQLHVSDREDAAAREYDVIRKALEQEQVTHIEILCEMNEKRVATLTAEVAIEKLDNKRLFEYSGKLEQQVAELKKSIASVAGSVAGKLAADYAKERDELKAEIKRLESLCSLRGDSEFAWKLQCERLFLALKNHNDYVRYPRSEKTLAEFDAFRSKEMEK